MCREQSPALWGSFVSFFWPLGMARGAGFGARRGGASFSFQKPCTCPHAPRQAQGALAPQNPPTCSIMFLYERLAGNLLSLPGAYLAGPFLRSDAHLATSSKLCAASLFLGSPSSNSQQQGRDSVFRNRLLNAGLAACVALPRDPRSSTWI